MKMNLLLGVAVAIGAFAGIIVAVLLIKQQVEAGVQSGLQPLANVSSGVSRFASALGL